LQKELAGRLSLISSSFQIFNHPDTFSFNLGARNQQKWTQIIATSGSLVALRYEGDSLIRTRLNLETGDVVSQDNIKISAQGNFDKENPIYTNSRSISQINIFSESLKEETVDLSVRPFSGPKKKKK